MHISRLSSKYQKNRPFILEITYLSEKSLKVCEEYTIINANYMFKTMTEKSSLQTTLQGENTLDCKCFQGIAYEHSPPELTSGPLTCTGCADFDVRHRTWRNLIEVHLTQCKDVPVYCRYRFEANT